MFFPIRTDRSLRRTPWVNRTLIALNVLVFLGTAGQLDQVFFHMGQRVPLHELVARLPVAQYMLFPSQPQVVQFVSYQFLHAGWEHILGNMLFLYVFGNSVEDRLGKVAYLLFYLAGGVVAGLGHAVIEQTTPVLGASGAVAAVSGAYLALFPISNVTILYWFIFIGTFEVSSMTLILFQIAQDAVLYVGRFGGVAYLAHLSGYAYGFVIGMGLLWIGLLTREPYDMLAMLERHRRRAQFRSLTRQGYQPWEHQPGALGKSEHGQASPTDDEQRLVMEMRSQINKAISEHRLEQAAEIYHDLLTRDAGQVLASQQQLDVANQLMANRYYDTAAVAYELFLDTYRNYGQREQIELILGLIYGRYLHQYKRAKELLSQAMTRLTDPQEKRLALQALKEIDNSADAS